MLVDDSKLNYNGKYYQVKICFYTESAFHKNIEREHIGDTFLQYGGKMHS